MYIGTTDKSGLHHLIKELVDTRYNAFGVTLQLPDFECENDPFAYDAQLAVMMGS